MQFNESFFEQLSRSPRVEALCVEAAESIAADLRATGPRDTDAYINGIEVQVKRQKRVVALVVGTDRKTMLLESVGGYMARALQRWKRRPRT